MLLSSLSLNALSVVSVAHRGAPHFAPENTLSSFRKAIELKADWLETDVQRSSDGHLVIMHDSSVDRTTNGSGKVSELTLQELLKLDAGSGEKIPTLDEVLALFHKDNEVIFVLELKKGNDEHPGIEEKLIQTIQAHKLERRVILKSFSIPVLKRLRKLAPEIPQIYVFLGSFPSLGLTVDTFLRFHNPFNLDVEYLQSHGCATSAAFVRAAHAHGKKVIVWGVEKVKKMKTWKATGVEGIETDRLDLYHQI